MNPIGAGRATAAVACVLRDGTASGLTDAELLARFIDGTGEAGEVAFALLVARHGPMVLNVCRRILRDPTEADDAFQATFLVLARRAAAVRVDHSLGPWLHGVSRRVARRLQAVATRRSALCLDGDSLRSITGRGELTSEGIERRLDVSEALDALPAAFREVLMCYLEGLTHEEAAARLACPVGTVRSRLARGRALLRDRLGEPDETSAGVASGAGLIVVSPSLIHSTARAAAHVATGGSATRVVSARVVELTTGVIATMYRTRIAAACAVLVLASIGVFRAWAGPGVGNRTGRAAAGSPRTPAARTALQDTAAGGPSKPASELPDDFPAFVVETVPRLGAIDVDAATTKEIRVTFSKPMMDGSWSWTTGNAYATPETTGKIHYLNDGRTCVMPCKLEPSKTYVMGINGGRFENFKDRNGRPALPSAIAFRTRAAR